MLCILVDEYILEQCEEKINLILNSFKFSPSYMLDGYSVHSFFIIQEKDKKKYSTQNKYAINNLENDKWILELINDLDVFVTEVLKCTVLHGSCIKLNEKNVLLLGERWSGKTTLAYYLSTECDGEYVSDDCVYIVNKHYYGLCTPLPIRNYEHINAKYGKNILTSVMDSDNVLRTLLLPPKVLGAVPNIDVVLLPQYISNGERKIIKRSPSEAFKAIIKNVHSFKDMRSMYLDIIALSNNAQIYSMTYSNSQSAYNMLMNHVFG